MPWPSTPHETSPRCRASSISSRPGTGRAAIGLPLDPEPVAGAPFLFTIAGLADDAAAELPPLPPLSEEAKAALRQEVGLADEYANMVGREVCGLLLRHRIHIQAAISQHVEPQIEALLAELTQSLDSPFDPDRP
jgi:hypothetical protein